MTLVPVAQRRTTHIFCGLLRDPLLGPVDAPATFSIALRLEDEPIAIRVAFGNDIALDYQVSAVAARLSTTYGDGFNPSGQAPWALLSAGADGRTREDRLVEGAGPRQLVVHGNGGGVRVPSLTWTSWTPIQSVKPEDCSGRPIVFIRVSVPPWTSPRCCNTVAGKSEFLPGREVSSFIQVGQDLATAPGFQGGGFKPWNGSPVYCVQYLTHKTGVTVLWSGDSHFSGSTTFGNISSFALQSCFQLSTPEFPVSPANYAWPGSPSKVFLPLFQRMIDLCKPQILLLQGWTSNDALTEQAVRAYDEQIISIASKAMEKGIPSVILTRFPRESLAASPRGFTAVEWIKQQQLRRADPTTLVVDVAAVLDDPKRPGAYRYHLTDDGTHPNTLGHAEVAAMLTPALRGLIANMSQSCSKSDV